MNSITNKKIKHKELNKLKVETLCKIFKSNLDIDFLKNERAKLLKEFKNTNDIFYLAEKTGSVILSYYFSDSNSKEKEGEKEISECLNLIIFSGEKAKKESYIKTEYSFDMFGYYFYLGDFNKAREYAITGEEYFTKKNKKYEILGIKIYRIYAELGIGNSDEAVDLTEKLNKIIIEDEEFRAFSEQFLRLIGHSFIDYTSLIKDIKSEFYLCTGILLKEYYPDLALRYIEKYTAKTANVKLEEKANVILKEIRAIKSK